MIFAAEKYGTGPGLAPPVGREATLTPASFDVGRLPRIAFGAGRLGEVPSLAAGFGRSVLLVTGAHSFTDSPHWTALRHGFEHEHIRWEHLRVDGEPSPALVDAAVRRWRGSGITAVVGVGGGSVLDAAKAIAGLLPGGDPVMDFLEGVGPQRAYRGPALPFLAVPTTAGTGSEATRNAVLSVAGPDGFKKSFRDERLVAQWAIVDPDLLADCPPRLIAANGMDALTQLIESYVSLRANPFTDALVLGALERVRDALPQWYENAGSAEPARTELAYAALVSGIALAQTGLGSVHGLAAPLGAFFPIPHGAACGTMLAAATALNVRTLRQREPQHPALAKYARIAEALTARPYATAAAAHDALVHRLEEWTAKLELPRLRAYGVGDADLPRVVAHCRGSSMRTNPIVLADEELTELLEARL